MNARSTPLWTASLIALVALQPLSARDGAQAEKGGAGDAPQEASSAVADALDLMAGTLADEVEVVRVVSGDTLLVRRNGVNEEVHLLSVDTEEPLGLREAKSSKPQTPFGEECFKWVRETLQSFAEKDGITRVELVHPPGGPRRDYFGRFLCHVVLPDGRDLNLLLVRSGRSPYYNKYGNSETHHDDFVAAQMAARAKRLGIWDPQTNADPKGETEKRPYDLLLPWWNARAEAIDGFRKRKAEDPEHVVSADNPAVLERAAAAGEEVDVFGEIGAVLEEDGSLAIVLRASDRRQEVRVLIPAVDAADHPSFGFAKRQGTFLQNFFWVRGRLKQTARGFEIVSEGPQSWRMAGPDPEYGED
jgi:endonuclease YncB( thermonuclease family)